MLICGEAAIPHLVVFIFQTNAEYFSLESRDENLKRREATSSMWSV